MMKFNIISILFATSLFLFSCDANDPIEELSETGEFAPNIYFVPISPIAFVNTTIEGEVEYWTEGDDITNIDFLHTIYLLDNVKLDLKDVTYSYRYEGTRDKVEEEVYQSITHKFTNFVPAKSAYVIKPTYDVPAEFKKITYAKNNTSLTVLNAAINEEIKEDFFTKIASGLSKDQLHTLLVDVNEVVTETTFETYFLDNDLTEKGLADVITHLKGIGIPSLVKDNFSYEVAHRVVLSFRIENGYGAVAESVARGFNVN